MRVVVLDFETKFDRKAGYSLDKMSTESYIRDPRFKAHGAAIKWQHNIPARWYDGAELRHVLKNEDWSDVFLICHHMQFDGLILSHWYDVHPKMLGCTLSMARLLLGNHLSVSLDSVRKHFNMPPKRTPYHLFDGKRWEELTPAVRQELADGACDEVESIWKIFGLLYKDFPLEELTVVDTTMKMFTEPVLRGDVDLLGKVWIDEAQRKQQRMDDLGITEELLQSAPKFTELLQAEGIDIQYKEGKNGPIPAFAKTDEFMRGLLEHDNERIRTLAEARLGAKSTLMQTRAETLGWMARRGSLPVYLRYAGAGTLRVSGGDGANWVNFKRRSPIRSAILAPDGYWLAPVDSSQIECRVCHYLAGGPDEPVIKLFREGRDPYIGLASEFYGEEIYKPKDDDPRKYEMEAKRGMGKQGRLMCQYGASGKQFKITAKNGLYGPSVDIPIEDATRFVALYRETNPSICARNTGYWAQASRMLARLGGGDPCDWGPLHVENHRIYLPNGCPLIYDTLEYFKPAADEAMNYREFERNGFWRVKTRQGWKTMWGSKLVQNICEAVARVIVSQAMNRITARGYRILNWPYDELLCLIPRDGHEDRHVQILLDEMRLTPDWLPGLPLDAECMPGERYSK